MNHIWNQTLACWQVVTETTSSFGETKSKKTSGVCEFPIVNLKAIYSVLLFAFSANVFAEQLVEKVTDEKSIVEQDQDISQHQQVITRESVYQESVAPISSGFKQKYIQDKLSLIVDSNHYSWHSDNQRSGFQTIIPITATYKLGNAEFGARTAYIESENTSAGRRGRVSTISDTALSAAYVQQLNRGWSVRYNLDYNLPTGKATLSGTEKNAIMDGNLVQQTRFGEGHNLTPGFVVTKAFTQNFALGLGLSHTYRGSFDPNGDVSNDKFNPGDEDRATLQAHYQSDRMLAIGGIIYTKSGTTQVDGKDYFEKGDRYDANLTTIFALPYNQQFLAGLRYSTQSPDAYINNITGNFEKESRNINGDTKFANLEYSKIIKDKHRISVSADYLSIEANSYDQLNDLYNAGRKKWSVGFGYGYQADKKTRFNVGINHFDMTDKATPATLVDTKYAGWNVSAGLSLNF